MSTPSDKQMPFEFEERLDVHVLFKFIKPFDGSREKLNSFISNCNNAMLLAANAQKAILFRFIQSQLEGRAETACAIKEFDNWEQLSLFLKTQFGEKKHFAHLLSDLQECRQIFNEPVNQYALKLETCLSKLLTEITLSNQSKKKAELAGKVSAMEDLALHTFLMGLTPRISNLVRCKNPTSLNEAINLAISEEKIQKLLYKKNNTNTNNNTLPKPQRKPETFFRPSNINQVTQDSNVPTCRYCKSLGHTIDICKKRQYNNKRFNISQPDSYKNTPNQKPQPRVHMINNEDNDNYGRDEIDNKNLND